MTHTYTCLSSVESLGLQPDGAIMYFSITPPFSLSLPSLSLSLSLSLQLKIFSKSLIPLFPSSITSSYFNLQTKRVLLCRAMAQVHPNVVIH